MLGMSSLSAGLHHLKIAGEYYQDFIRSNPGSYGARLFKKYIEKIDWIVMDILSNPIFPEDIRNGMREDLNNDVLAISSLEDKIHDLTPELRELAEEMLDIMLSGESFEIQKRTNEGM